MAAPTYATDLTTIVDYDGTTGTASEPATGWTAGRSPTNSDTDFPIQSSTHASLTMNTTGDAGLVTTGSSFTWTSGDYLFGWIIWLAPGAIDTKANGGLVMLCGSSTSAYKAFYVGGKDFGAYPYGGWQNFAVDPTLTADETFGSPSAYNVVGCGGRVLSAVAKGNPLGNDVFRYGRGEFQVSGGDSTNGYATFSGMAAANDASTARWGLFQAVDGGYKFKGLMTLGSGSATEFVDANKSIVVDNTGEVNSDFNKIEIRNASSVIDWTNISITQLGITGTYTTASVCSLAVIDNATVDMDACTFTDMGAISYLSNSTITGSTFRRCGAVSTGGGNFSGCLFTHSTATSAVTTTSPANAALVTNSDFVSSGTGHGLEITGTAANMTLTNCNWSGYAATDGSTGNEAVYVNIASGSMNLTIDGGTTPSVRTAGASVTVISGAVTVTAKTVTENGTNIQNARVHLEAASGGVFPVAASVTISNSGTTATVTHNSHGLATNDKVVIRGASLNENLGVHSITVTDTNTYTYTMASAPGSSPTGTITSTFVVLNGLTDVNGEISMSRVFSGSQPVTGRARKSSSEPYYKNANLTGTVSSSTGGSFTAVMISDD